MSRENIRIRNVCGAVLKCNLFLFIIVNRLNSKGNYSVTSNNTTLVHWPLMGGLLHLVQRGGPGLKILAKPLVVQTSVDMHA